MNLKETMVELRFRKPAKIALVKQAAEENRSVLAFCEKKLVISNMDFRSFRNVLEKNLLLLKERL